MDYYEELGLKPTATEEDIRRAHRRLVKLFHPDQQTDEAMKQLAETQMRRLNSIVEVLSDPERRRIYDEQLRGDVLPFSPGAVTVRPAPKRSRVAPLPWWLASTVGAVALTVGAVWFWANNWGSSFNNSRTPVYIPSAASASEAPAPASVAPSPSATAPATTTVQVEKKADTAHRNSRTLTKVSVPAGPTKTAVRSKTSALDHSSAPAPVPQRKALILANTLASANVRASSRSVNLDVAPPPNVQTASVAHPDPSAVPVTSLPLVTGPPAAAAPGAGKSSALAPSKANPVAPSVGTVQAKTIRQDPLEGEWVYVPSQSDGGRPGFYPPEFIDLKLFSTESGLRGQYHAKYRVSDRPIPPEVNFTLSPSGTNKFLWQAANGSRGTFKISSIDASSIRVEWKTTVYSHGLALTAGTATLRKSQ